MLCWSSTVGVVIVGRCYCHGMFECVCSMLAVMVCTVHGIEKIKRECY